VAGVEGESAQEICKRLGAARVSSKRKAKKRPEGHEAPPPLRWNIDAAKLEPLEPIARRSPVNAGGLLRAPGFGRAQWAEVGVNPESAVLLAMRLALDTVAPELDDLTCMVNAGHVQEAFATPIGTTTPAMRALLSAARDARADIGQGVAVVLAEHRKRVGDAKRFQSREASMQFTFFSIGLASRLVRSLLGLVTLWVSAVFERNTPPEERKDMMFPVVAIDSSIPAPEGIVVVGRFGAPAPPRAFWSHHSIGENETRFVVQVGMDRMSTAKRLREELPIALARVLSAARARGEVAPVDSIPASATPRLAYRRLLWLRAALRGAGSGST
jgi:hypothetical protein